MDAPAIHAEGLRKCFGDVVALDGVDLAVPTGTVLGLLGPNGAGKTTAVRILTTILTPTAGTATILGIDVTANPDAVRTRIGLAGQFAAVDENLTGRENLILVGRLTHQPKATILPRAAELLDRFRLSDAADRTVKTYSGGMRRRLDLAAALVHRPPVLFLDEPTTGLDPRSRLDLWGVIEELVRDGTTLLLTTQYLEEADRLADRIVVIDHGRVIAEGTAERAQGPSRHDDHPRRVRRRRHRSTRRRACSPKSARPTSATTAVALEVNVGDGGPALLDAVRRLDAARPRAGRGQRARADARRRVPDAHGSPCRLAIDRRRGEQLTCEWNEHSA